MVAPCDVSSGRTLWGMAECWAKRRSGEAALVYLPDASAKAALQSVTWEHLVTDVWDLRCRLSAIGVSEQRAVLLALPNSLLSVALWLAIPSNGAVIQVMDPESGRLAFERAMTMTRPVAVIAAPSNAGVLAEAISGSGLETRLVVPTDLGLAGSYGDALGLATKAPSAPAATDDLVAGLLPTSGTSGLPKLVELTHRNYVMGAERLARNSGYLTSDRHYLCSPLFHTNGQIYLCSPPFVTGGSLAIVPRFSASGYFEAARHTGATVSSMVAPPMRMALHSAMGRGDRADRSTLRLIQYGMSLSSADWEAWDRLFPEIAMRQIYGQTESVTGVLGGAVWEEDDRRSIGRPFLGVDGVRLVGPEGEDVADGEPGELWVAGTPGVTLMRGYHDAPGATAASLEGGRWLRTGDVMVRDRQGRFTFRGRRMHIIRRGGENLSTYALELDLQSCPLVSDVAVTAREDDTLDALVVAHVIASPTFDEKEFLAWCREHLGRQGVPDEVVVHASFPRTASGRVIARDL